MYLRIEGVTSGRHLYLCVFRAQKMVNMLSKYCLTCSLMEFHCSVDFEVIAVIGIEGMCTVYNNKYKWYT